MYKQDTDRFTQWLGSTAMAAGFTAADLDLDGDGEHAKATAAEPSTTVLRTEAIVAMAKWIAQADPAITVPPPILACVARAVVARRKCANWFLSLADDSSANSQASGGSCNASPGPTSSLNRENSSHLHFISVLESVLAILSPLVHPARKSTSKHSTALSRKHSSTPVHSNTFSPLAADHDKRNASASSSDEDEDEDLDYGGPRAPQPTRQQYRMAEEDGDVDLIFIIHSHFAEIQQVRQFVKDTWIQYRDGKIDLSTASMTTTCAVDLVREAQADLYTAFPAFNPKTFVSLILLVYIQACLLRKEHPYSTDAYVKFNEATEDLADFLMLRSAHLAMQFAGLYHKMPGGQLDLAKFFTNTFDEWGTYDPLVDRSQLSARDKYHEDSTLLMSLSPFIHGVAVMDELPYPYLDAFTLEIGQLTAVWSTKGLCCEPIVAFVTQVFFDIHHLLRDRVCHGFNDLKSTAQSIITSLDAFDRNQYGDKGTVHENLTTGMGYLRGIIQDTVFEDPYASLAGQPPQFKLLHPWLCGLLQYRLLYVYQAWAFSAAIHWGSIPSSCHLYEAAKREGYLGDDHVWADMEFVMRMHTKAGMFRGKIPSNRIEAFTALQLVRGVSAVQMSLATREMIGGGGRFRRKAGKYATTVTNRGEDHRPPESCPLAVWMHPWFESCTTLRSPFMVYRAESGLLDIARSRHHTHEPHLQSLNKYNSGASSASSTSAPPSSLPINPHTSQPYFAFDSDDDRLSPNATTPGARASRKLTPLVLLTSFRAALDRESTLLQFDYWAFHLQCIRLHYLLASATQPFLSSMLLDRLHSSPVSVNDIIPNVFHFTSPVMRACHPQSKEYAHSNQVLRLVFQALAELIRAEGNTQVEKMRKRAKYVGLRAQVPQKDARPPDKLWHAFTQGIVDELQRTWDRDVTPMEGFDAKLVEMVRNRDSMELAGMKLTVAATSTKQRAAPRARPVR